MTNDMTALSRRAVFAAAGAAGLAAALPAIAQAAEAKWTEAEEANVKLVKGFINGWTKKDYNAGKEMAEYLAADCVVRPIDSQPALTKPADAAKVFTDFSKDGSRVARVEFAHVLAKGPMVITDRSDFVTTPGKPDSVYKVMGVFHVKDGKISEWTDFLC